MVSFIHKICTAIDYIHFITGYGNYCLGIFPYNACVYFTRNVIYCSVRIMSCDKK